MPRKARDQRLDTRTVRLNLTPRREPYWRTIEQGRAIGYRRLAGGKAGTWIARHYSAEDGRTYCAIGNADDMSDADGSTTFTFAQAQDAAREWFRKMVSPVEAVEPVTVRQAAEYYLIDYAARGGKSLDDVKTCLDAHILPQLGELLVGDLTTAQVSAWHRALALAPVRLRTASKANAANVRRVAATDTEGRRARRSSANRILTVLKAVLNLAFREGMAASDDAWRRVSPFKKVDAPRIRYLTDDEAARLMNACPPDLRALVTAALLTGARYQELATLRPADVDPVAGLVTIRASKSGKARAVVLTAEAVRFMTEAMAGKGRDAILFPREDGEAWGKSHQFRPMVEACRAARIDPPIGFHILRHTHASRLAMRGVPLTVIAHQLGHASVAITSRYYAHLAPSYIADTIRDGFGELGIGNATPTVIPLRRA